MRKTARRRRQSAPSPIPDEAKILIWACILFGAWFALVFAAQAANARPAETAAAITPGVCAAHAAADGWDL